MTLFGTKTYGGVLPDGAHGVWRTLDGRYVVAGTLGDAGFRDALLLRLASDGSVAWEKTYGDGGTQEDFALSVQQISDGGLVVAGFTGSFGATTRDPWVLKLKADGAAVWQNRYDSGAEDMAWAVRQTSDGGYAVAAGPFNTARVGPFFVLRLKPDGSISESCPAAIGSNTMATPQNSSAVVQNSNTFARGAGAVAQEPNGGLTITDATVRTFREVFGVQIDIKPGSDPNPKAGGTTPALLTRRSRPCSEIDRTSLTFGRTGDEQSLAFCTKSGEDLNGVLVPREGGCVQALIFASACC